MPCSCSCPVPVTRPALGSCSRYLSLVAAQAVEADYVLIPEWPATNWEAKLLAKLRAASQLTLPRLKP